MKIVIPNLSSAISAKRPVTVLRAVRAEGKLFLLRHCVSPHCTEMQEDSLALPKQDSDCDSQVKSVTCGSLNV